MSIRPVDMNGVIQRTQDVGTLKQHQDMKPMVDQQNIQIEVQREEYRQSEQVTRKDDSQMEEHRFDAKEEGKGQYQRQEQRKKKTVWLSKVQLEALMLKYKKECI